MNKIDAISNQLRIDIKNDKSCSLGDGNKGSDLIIWAKAEGARKRKTARKAAK